jgi:hypothetical protein
VRPKRTKPLRPPSLKHPSLKHLPLAHPRSLLTRPPDKAATKPPENERETSFAVVPGPFYNPNLGVGVNVLPMLMFHPNKNDSVSPPSLAIR